MITNYCTLFSAAVRDLPQLSALAQAILSQAEDLISLIPSLQSAFSAETAEGVQLDLIGETMSIPRSAAMDSSDETYRALLKAKLSLWRWDGTNESVRDLLAEAFPGQGVTMTDNGNMTVTVVNMAALPAIAEVLLPLPAGVELIET